MADFKMPYGAEFSPNKIKIKEVLKLDQANKGQPTDKFVEVIAKKYFNNNQTMGANCKNSMVAYEILENGGGISLSSFGWELALMKKEDEIYEAMSKHILTCLSGLTFIEAIRITTRGGNRPTLESVTVTLNLMGCEELSKTNKHIPTMKKWLEKGNVLNGWDINEKKLEELTGMRNEEIEVLRGLNRQQVCFVRALCNMDSEDYQNATKVRDLAKASFNIDFPAKNFANAIISPLEVRGLIKKRPSTSTHGGNAAEIKLVDTVKTDVIAPVLKQIEIIAGNEVVKYCQKSLTVLREEIDSDDTYVKGLALEAFAIKMMRIIDLDFVKTRIKGNETGGAEIDALFDTTRLNYSRWQVQCKNTKKVSLDQVAKEVGLSHVLKSNVIVILTTGRASETAKEYATTIMKEMNLCIIFIEGNDISEILDSPASIVDVLNRESMKAKKIKVLEKIDE